jgi:flagellar basal body-associated protein FliL
MNKKLITPIIVVLVLALLVAAIIFAPNILETALRMHGMR